MIRRLLIALAMLLLSQGSHAQYGYSYSYMLNVITSAGGSVVNSGAAMTCMAMPCSSMYSMGMMVTLTALPASGYQFTGWDGDCSGTGTCTINMNVDRLVMANFSPIAGPATPTTGFWWNPAEPGRGYMIERRGNNMFVASYLYDASGRASWVVSVGAMASSADYSGALLQFGSGQTLTGAYRANAALPTPGNVALNFTSTNSGTLTWPGGTVPIQRFDVVSGGSAMTPAASTPEAGWWWNPAESGRGFAIEIQGNSLFIAGYMYDSSGNPIWYGSGPAPMANASNFVGTWVQFGGGQTLTGSFRAAAVANANIGPITIQFLSTTTATMTLPDGRQIAIERFRF